MRTIIVLSTVCTLACGGSQKRDDAEKVAFDPEMSEACLAETIGDAAPACERAPENGRAASWSFPLAEGEELARIRRLAREDPEEPALEDLFGSIIAKAERVDCSGEGCARYARNVRCEAEVARAERAEALVAQERWRAAFYDAAAMLRAGPSHYGYERLPELMRKIEPHVGAAVHVCMSAY